MPLSLFFHRMLSFPLASWLYLATPFSPPRPLLPVFILILLLRHPVSFVLSTLLFVPFLHLLLYRFLSSSVCPFKLRSFSFLIVAARIPFLSSTGPPRSFPLFLTLFNSPPPGCPFLSLLSTYSSQFFVLFVASTLVQ